MTMDRPADRPTDTDGIEPLDGDRLRRCLSRFSTGVTVVTYAVDGTPRGTTVNSFTSVSLRPPLVLVSVARMARACAQLDKGPFAVNILRADQLDVALQFAGRPRPGARIRWQQRPGFAPQLDHTVAVLQCRPWRAYDGGDHVLHLGEVITATTVPGEPLLFSEGEFTTAGLPLPDGPRIVTSWVEQARTAHDHAAAC